MTNITENHQPRTHTGILRCEDETAVYLTDQLITEQAEKIHQLEENLKFWLEQAGILQAANEELQAANTNQRQYIQTMTAENTRLSGLLDKALGPE